MKPLIEFKDLYKVDYMGENVYGRGWSFLRSKRRVCRDLSGGPGPESHLYRTYRMLDVPSAGRTCLTQMSVFNDYRWRLSE
jgi:hypothetical protein